MNQFSMLESCPSPFQRTRWLWAFSHEQDWKHWRNMPKGWFPVSRNFYVRTCVKFTFANEIEAVYERSLVSVKVEPRSTTLSLKLSTFYLASILFTWLKFTCVTVRYRALPCVTVRIQKRVSTGKSTLRGRNWALRLSRHERYSFNLWDSSWLKR